MKERLFQENPVRSDWIVHNKIAFNGLYAAALSDQAPDDSIQLSLSFAF